MRANIYSLEQLEPPTLEAIHVGLDMVAAYIGETVISKDYIVRLPQTPDGLIDPAKVGCSKLDKLVELHVMAVPLVENVGLSRYGRGVSFVNVI